MSRTTHLFQAMWPITDPALPTRYLIAQAAAEIDELALRSHAHLLARPRWSRRMGSDVPGSGGADEVLVALAPAVEVPRVQWAEDFERVAKVPARIRGEAA